MDTQIINEEKEGFIYQGRFSPILDITYLREKIACHISFVRGEIKNEESAVLSALEFNLDSFERN